VLCVLAQSHSQSLERHRLAAGVRIDLDHDMAFVGPSHGGGSLRFQSSWREPGKEGSDEPREFQGRLNREFVVAVYQDQTRQGSGATTPARSVVGVRIGS